MSDRKPRVVDLFCGAGGLSEGFQHAGFDVVTGLDFDPVALSTFSRNHRGAKAICGDIRGIASDELGQHGEIDVLIGGPSCQGFSTHGKRIAEDPRNFLFREFVRVARDLRPSWIVIENVKGLLTYDKGAFRQRIHESLEDLGYAVDSRLLLAADYGVPQLRERLFFVATLTGCPIRFPQPTHGERGRRPWLTVRDAISDLPGLGMAGGKHSASYTRKPRNEYQAALRQGSNALTLHEAQPVSALALSIISQIPQGNGIRYLTEHDLPTRFRRMRTIANGQLRRDCTTLYHRLAWNRPSYTITCNFKNVSSGPFTHPVEHRAISWREAARLQSFADAYEFEPRSIAKQIGNAVPPLLAKAVARQVMRGLRSGQIDTSPEDDVAGQLLLRL